MKTFYKESIFILCAILVFFIPLIFSTFTIEAFSFPKNVFFYTFSTLIIIFYSIENIVQKNNILDDLVTFLKKFWYIFAFLLINIISSLFSGNFYTSFWGYYGRFDGSLLSTIFQFLVLFIIYKTFSTENYVKLFMFSLFSSVIVSVYGIFQYYSYLRNTMEPRVYSTVGHPNWLAQYLVLFLPILIYFLLDKKIKLTRNENILMFIAYYLLFWCFWLTYSLSGVLAFFVSCLFIYFLVKSIDYSKLAYLFLISMLVIITNFSFVSARFNDLYIDTKRFITEAFTVYAEDSYLISDSGFIRKEIWVGTLNLFLSSPKIFFLGVGPQNFVYEFQKYRPRSLNYSSEWEYVINRPHNYYLELLVETGLFGLMFYLLFMFNLIKQSPKFLTPSLIAFFISNIFGWPVISSTLIFLFMTGFIIYDHK